VDDLTERWLPVPGYEGLYEVSDLGNVRSFHAGRGSGKRGGLLAPGLSGRYLTVALCQRGQPRRSWPVHQLVLLAFAGPRPPGMESLHGPGGQLDNRLVNLCWGTPSQNHGPDRVRDGTSNRGERSRNAKLTEAIVSECKRRYAAGETQTALAIEFGVTEPAICEAVNGVTWAHLADGAEVRPRTWLTGERHWAAKVTWADVAEIRRRAAAGEHQRPLAREFGISQPVVSKIVRREIWRGAPELSP
jgi:hypothetical protein